MAEHLGLLTEIGPVAIDVPRDVDASFQPETLKKRQRRLNGVDEMMLPLAARGLTTVEMSVHFAEVYGASASKDTVFKITWHGGRGDDRWGEPAAGRGLLDELRGCDRGQGQRRAGRQPADLPG